MLKDSKIFVAGHRGLAGSALMRALTASGYANLITRTHAQLDLMDQSALRSGVAAAYRDFLTRFGA